LLTIALARPLIQRKVKPNALYGVRIPAAFTSEEAWYELNEYGGRLLLRWGAGLALGGIALTLLPRAWWAIGNGAAVIATLASLGVVIALTARRGRRFAPRAK
jgi:uncharacterized membrane protein